MSTPLKSTADRLRELMEYYGISQSDISKTTGIAKSSVSMYVSGQRKPGQDNLSDIAEAYNVDEAWLLGYDVPMKPNSASKSGLELGQKIGELIEKDIRFKELINNYYNLDEEARELCVGICKKMNRKADKS